MKMNIRKGVLACMLITGLISSGTYVPAASEKITAEPAANSTAAVFSAEPMDSSETENDDYYYLNEDPAEVRNAKITVAEAQAAREERLIPERELGYEYGTVLVDYERAEAQAAAKRLGLDSEWELYKKHLREQGDISICEVFKFDNWIMFNIQLNEHKAVQTAIQKYEQLEGVNYAQPNYFNYSGPSETKNDDFYYLNEDPAEVRNAKITEKEAQAAREERLIPEEELGYEYGTVLVNYERGESQAAAKRLGLDSEWELYKKHLREQGDVSICEVVKYDNWIIFSIQLNEHKAVQTAIQKYEQLEGVNYAQPNYFYYPDTIVPSDEYWYFKNDDEESIKNADISQEEAQAAQKEHDTSPSVLGYYPGSVIVTFDRAKAAAEAKQQGLPGELDLYKKMLNDLGDYTFFVWQQNDKMLIAHITLNEKKTVHTAIQQYETLNYVNHAQSQKAQVSNPIRVDGIYSICQDNFISLGCVHENAGENTKFRWEYCVIGQNEWHLIEDWNSSEWCNWFPDANENYAVVCKISYTGSGSADQQTVWYASRPQMAKQITGRCAMPTEDGLLIGCTSNISATDTDYQTACYIWSCDRQAWIDVAAYHASNCAWYRSSNLPKGNYIVYNCTEIDIPGTNTHRKLSCDYYLMYVH